MFLHVGPPLFRLIKRPQSSPLALIRKLAKRQLDILKEKRPSPQIINQHYSVPNENTLPYHPPTFDKINAFAIKRNALKANGSHGPSGVDANESRNFLTTFKTSFSDLRNAIAMLAITLPQKL